MKLFDFFLLVVSSILLVTNQVVIKYWLTKRDISVWPLNAKFILNIFSVEILITIISIISSGLIIMHLIKKVEFSILFPSLSISYIFGLLAATFIFKENVSWIRWVGVIVIMVGIFFVSRN